MPRRFFLHLAVLVLLCLSSLTRADVQCAGLFSDHMVLQRDVPVNVWGDAAPGEQVTVQIAKQSKSTKADAQGQWKLALDPMPAGGPHVLTVKAANTLEFQDVMVGEVWLCSGQSNMAWTVNSAADAEKEIAAATDSAIRHFRVPSKVAAEPQSQTKGTWNVASPQTVGQFSAAAYFFGRHLRQQLNVPIGLINSSVGGTFAEAWTPRPALDAQPSFREILAKFDSYPQEYPKLVEKYQQSLAQWTKKAEEAKAAGQPEPAGKPRQPSAPEQYRNQASVLYNGMIAPLVPYTIRGAIWYQGEANANRMATNQAHLYRQLMPTLITSWRAAWGQGDFPFLIVQLPNYLKAQEDPNENPAWAVLRESQAVAARTAPNVGLTVNIDIGEAGSIHPLNKQDIGRRLGLLAEQMVYSRDVVAAGPVFDSMKIEGNKVRLQFKNAAGLTAKGGKPQGFVLAGQDQKFHWADAVIDGQSIVLSSDQVPNPVAVRYAWANNPPANVYNDAGLPLAPFRTDEW